MTPTIRVQRDDFDLRAETTLLTKGKPGIGAIVTFTGLCRDEGGTLSALELEHYPGMAEAEMLRIANLAIERFELKGLTAIHRYGKIAAGENIVLVVTASSHREAAFQGAEFLMDYLKTRAPFWKREERDAGNRWVEAHDRDDSAAARWTKS